MPESPSESGLADGLHHAEDLFQSVQGHVLVWSGISREPEYHHPHQGKGAQRWRAIHDDEIEPPYSGKGVFNARGNPTAARAGSASPFRPGPGRGEDGEVGECVKRLAGFRLAREHFRDGRPAGRLHAERFVSPAWGSRSTGGFPGPFRERRAEVDGGRGLPGAALLIDDRDLPHGAVPSIRAFPESSDYMPGPRVRPGKSVWKSLRVGYTTGEGPWSSGDLFRDGKIPLRSNALLTARLIELIQANAERLTRDVLKDYATNPRTRHWSVVPSAELEQRVVSTYRNLGNWIGDPREEAVQAEYEEWGRKRYRNGIPLSEVVFAVILLKHHLRKYIREHGLVEHSRAATPRRRSFPSSCTGSRK